MKGFIDQPVAPDTTIVMVSTNHTFDRAFCKVASITMSHKPTSPNRLPMQAKNVMAAAQILVDEHGGEVPVDREQLVDLPGVGRKTLAASVNA